MFPLAPGQEGALADAVQPSRHWLTKQVKQGGEEVYLADGIRNNPAGGQMTGEAQDQRHTQQFLIETGGV